jgi:hypothetical protein
MNERVSYFSKNWKSSSNLNFGSEINKICLTNWLEFFLKNPFYKKTRYPL